MSGLWVSAHVHTTAPARALLLGPVEPLLADARRFFFIRYGEGGPHLRLRFLLPDAPAAAHFRAAASTLLRSHDVRFALYEPEIDRYGGVEGVAIAERQFEASSRAVLQLMKADAPPLAAAIAMHITFAISLGMTREDAVVFFAALTRDFVRWHPDYAPERGALDRIALDYETRFAAQREPLAGGVAALWDGLLDEPWLADWRAAMHDVARDLDRLPLTPAARHTILASYVHMSNNRLGVPNPEEPYLAYLLKRSLQC